MDDLITFNNISPISIINKYTLEIRNLNMYSQVNKPVVYVCNLEKIFNELKENKINIIYSKNRPPDNKKINDIVLYQQSVGYDTIDWKITAATVNENDFKLIDGGHRALAALDLLNIIGELHVYNFSSELERFEKFKIINISSDLPDIYKLDCNDIYKILIDNIMSLIDNKYFDIDNSLYMDGFNTYAPFLEKEKFKTLLFLKRYLFFGDFINFIDNIDIEANKFIENINIINDEIVNKILFTGCGSAKFAELSILIQKNNNTCGAINKITNRRCTLNSIIAYKGFCGYHKKNETIDYNKIMFIDIISIVKRFNVGIGLLSNDDLLINYNNKFNNLMD